MSTEDSGYKVRLISVASYYRETGADRMERVIFDASPTVSESRRVEYSPVSPIHMPGSIQIYKNTAARDFSITAKLFSRTSAEALKNMEYLQLLRGWTQPYFGSSSTRTAPRADQRTAAQNAQDRVSEGTEMLGAPPDVLYLYAYSTNSHRSVQTAAINLHKIPVVLVSLDITYPEDVDYLPSSDVLPSPFPMRMDVNISLAETHSPAEYQKFNLADFKKGRLVNF